MRFKQRQQGCYGNALRTDLPTWGCAWASLASPTSCPGRKHLQGRHRALRVSRQQEKRCTSKWELHMRSWSFACSSCKMAGTHVLTGMAPADNWWV